MELIYSKKQLAPLVKKYGIDTEHDKLFYDVLELFNGSNNYQIWAVKAIYDHCVSFPNLKRIKEWADENQTKIQSLYKQNLINYKTQSDFQMLFKEIEGCDKIALAKSVIDKFNTAQRDMLRKSVLLITKTNPIGIKPYEASESHAFNTWYEIFQGFETLTEATKHKFLTVASAYTDVTALKNGMIDLNKETYDWNYESFMSFLKRQAKDCQVVFDNKRVVVLEVNSFQTAHDLCHGRTSWCLTRESDYFRQYVTSKNGRQYFVFDFGVKEKKEYSHIGFTVCAPGKITNAHSTNNKCLMNREYYDEEMGEYADINKILNELGITPKVYLKLKPLKNFAWKIDDLLSLSELNAKNFVVKAYNKENNTIILQVLSNHGFSLLTAHTFLCNEYKSDNDYFILIDFNKNVDDEKSLYSLTFKKDKYGIKSFDEILDAYGGKHKADVTNILSSCGFNMAEIVSRENIDPRILLHKLIDENNEKEAIDLIDKQGADFDVNYEFDSKKPIFSALEMGLSKLFGKIVSHPKFDSNIRDTYQEPILMNLIYEYLRNIDTSSVRQKYQEMIEMVLASNNYDFNSFNLNNDTAINICCEDERLTWILEILVSYPNVNVNVMNDFESTALTNAIRGNLASSSPTPNINAIKILGRRKDLIVTENDKKLASKLGINLEKYICKEAFLNDESGIVKNDTDEEFAAICAQIFSIS